MHPATLEMISREGGQRRWKSRRCREHATTKVWEEKHRDDSEGTWSPQIPGVAQQGPLEAASICKTRDKVLIYSLFIHSISQSPNHLSLVASIWATLLTMWKVLEPFHYSTCLSYQDVPPVRGVAKICVCPLLTSDLSVHICASLCEHVRGVALAELGKKRDKGNLKGSLNVGKRASPE